VVIGGGEGRRMTLEHTTRVREAARRYLAAGLRTLPLKGKKPWDLVTHRACDAWPHLVLTLADLERAFADEITGVGIATGIPPAYYVDVDLDCAEALAAAHVFLPPTGCIFGRPSTPRAHHIYQVHDDDLRVRRWKDPITHATLLELRGKGGQTVFPGSLHEESGDLVRFDLDGPPARVARADLEVAVERLAATTLLGRYWPQQRGSRHELSLAVAGVLLRGGLDEDVARTVLKTAAEVARDEQAPERMTSVRTTAARIAEGRIATGLPRLRELLPPAVVDRLVAWLRLCVQLHADARPYTDHQTRDPDSDDDTPRTARDNPWDRAISAAALLVEVDSVLDWLEPRLLSPEAITQWYSPRGLGKTQVALAIAIKLARAGHRVLLLDRDNPRREVKRRLRAWGAEGLATLDVMTRDDVPHLLDRTAWLKFPRGRYALVIIDSWDATSEGIGEQDSAKPSQATATLNDLAHVAGGPAVLVLGNTVKSGSHGRGSGVVEDRGDIVYEVRDATDLKPSGNRAWWAELPPAGREAWVDRAGRRKHRDRYRLAFVSSKFRLGEEPDPFALELDFTTEPWSLRDVTADLVAAGEVAADEAKEQAATLRAAAVTKLRAEVEARAAAKEQPYTKKRAAAFLGMLGLARAAARLLLEEEDGRSWRLVLGGARGTALLVLPLGAESASARPASSSEGNAAPEAETSRVGPNPVDVAEQRPASPPSEVPAAQGFANWTSRPSALGADGLLPPVPSACAARGSEAGQEGRTVSRKTPRPASGEAAPARQEAHHPEIPPRPAAATVEDVLAIFPGATVVSEGQPDVWPPAEIVEPTTDSLVLLARAAGLPTVPLRPGVTIVGADWAWQAFARTASPLDRADARAYLAQLPPCVPPNVGAWVPSPLRYVDPYTADPPTVPCPTCGSSTWHRAGDGWTCSTCHPQPTSQTGPGAGSTEHR
jgi:hypothetical protein